MRKATVAVGASVAIAAGIAAFRPQVLLSVDSLQPRLRVLTEQPVAVGEPVEIEAPGLLGRSFDARITARVDERQPDGSWRVVGYTGVEGRPGNAWEPVRREPMIERSIGGFDPGWVKLGDAAGPVRVCQIGEWQGSDRPVTRCTPPIRQR